MGFIKTAAMYVGFQRSDHYPGRMMVQLEHVARHHASHSPWPSPPCQLFILPPLITVWSASLWSDSLCWAHALDCRLTSLSHGWFNIDGLPQGSILWKPE
eukprot:CAMPEP_0174368570 /NCGR_PEP_ID=MMETSP0811_2-20130205/89642_1 /TAXON_ID=73025 ORGANISM="Eutreptiella gymnastica-like, Strain CCMP1594" /NCGR_SAMPLE_ID=MMETSP0811_2 /ASSEMBLY_ACC=CAM_ASM_000667 /LENGTH=99 /DNA_ID=CAMNT_0015512219 /DNA_START=78 /DNA_END=377 /DNA_ORIENTATION=+